MLKLRLILPVAALAFAATAATAQPDPRAPGVVASVRGLAGAEGLSPDARYAIAFSDLNDDHRPEAIVHLVDGAHCGAGGCTTFVLTEGADGWRSIGRMTGSRLPIYRLPGQNGGWFDLGVYGAGGVRAVRIQGGTYQSNLARGTIVARLPQQASLLLPVTSEMMPVGN
jgi:hypothetical protein